MTRSIGIVGSFIGVSIVPTLAIAQAIVHVDAGATGPVHDGSTWCRAYVTLEEGLGAAQRKLPGEIRIAKGVYTLDAEENLVAALFPQGRGLKVRGGYAGCAAPAPDLQDTQRFHTAIKLPAEDLNVGHFADRSDSTHHVVSADDPNIETVFRDVEVIVSGSSAFGSVCDFLGSPLAPMTTVVYPRKVYEDCGFVEPLPEVLGDDSQESQPPQADSGAGTRAVDVRVNNPAGDAHPNETQNETTVAVKDTTVCAAYNDDQTIGGVVNFVGFARSGNGGAAFVDQGSPGPSLGDPVLAVDADGDFALAHMMDGNNDLVMDQIVVQFSQDDCRTYPLTHFARTVVPPAVVDKPWLAVDRTDGAHNGNVYACWTEFDAAGVPSIMFRVGIPFVAPVITIRTGAANNLVQGCQVAVGNNSEVHVAWEEGANFRAGQAGSIRLRTSVNGGGAFAAAVTAGNLTHAADAALGAGVCGNFFGGAIGPAATPIRIQDFPSLAASPVNNDVYMVWNERIGGDTDVVFYRSINDGANWAFVTFPHGVVAKDQFMPAVTVAPNGVIKVQWYDRRRDPANTLIDLFAAESRNRGGAFADMRVSDVNFGLDAFVPGGGGGLAACYMGEYNGITSTAQTFYHVWGDNRDNPPAGHGGGGQPAVHLDPNVYFDTQSVSQPVAVPTATTLGLSALGVAIVGAGTLLFRRRPILRQSIGHRWK